MALVLGSMGPEKVYKVFSQWTDKIEAGELPFDKPRRPQGIERNVVFTMWDWANPKNYQHDAVSTDKRNPRVNANGKLYLARITLNPAVVFALTWEVMLPAVLLEPAPLALQFQAT